MNDWNPRANDLFLRAAGIDAEGERRQFLEQECGGDEALRQQVESLLAAGQQIGGFLERPAVLPTTTEHPPISEKPGSVIGPYKLLQELGEGGFGVVFMAEQTEPVKRRVALKVIKPGMDSKQVVARFEQERQALAMMDHPNIAKVLDGGTTESGRPYFVMELVKGVPITTFCDENRFGTRERLELFTQVCSAIQHAHQKGIIHRDIKPSNVLVATYDGKPVVKVIDFGVAKAIEQKLTEGTLFTRVGQVIGTLEYMSPEQASLNALDVDTRSDVYALGVLLYELLTGFTPLDKEKLRSLALDEMLRAIREEEPPRPSTRLSNSGGGLPLAASYRGTDSQKLTQSLQGELDWIALKALEKDRSRRYQSATGLAEDVSRYLRDEQVYACPPSWSYRAGKFLRKHKAAFTLASTAAALLLLGAIVSGWQAWEAIIARREAIDERNKTNDALMVASRERDSAWAARAKAREAQYGLSMSLIPAAWEADDTRRVADLLEQLRPGPDEKDLRHFEWHYWDRRLHQERRSVTLDESGRGATMSGDGTRAAFWNHPGKEGEPILKVVDVQSGEVLFSTTPGKDASGFSALTLNQDGSRIAFLLTDPAKVKSINSRVEVWDVTSDKRLFEKKAQNRGFASTLELDPSGKRLVTVENLSRGDDHVVKVWDLTSPEQEPIFTIDANRISGRVIPPPSSKRGGGDSSGSPTVAFSPDGSRVAIVVYSRLSRTSPTQSVVQIWDIASRNRRGHLQVKDYIPSIAFSPDGKRLAGVGQVLALPGGADSWLTVRMAGKTTLRVDSAYTVLWNVAAGAEIEEMRLSPLNVTLWQGRVGAGPKSPEIPRLTYSPDGRLLAVWMSSESPVVRLVDAATGAASRVLRSLDPQADAVFSKDSKRLFTLNPGRIPQKVVCKEWDVEVPDPVEDAPKDPKSPSNDKRQTFSRDGERQAIFSPVGMQMDDDVPPTISIRDRDGKEIHVFREHEKQQRITSVTFNHNGRLVLSRAGNENKVWETDTGKVLGSFAPPRGALRFYFPSHEENDHRVSPDGRLLALLDDGVKIVNFDDLTEQFSIGKAADVWFCPGGRRLLSFHPNEEKTTTPDKGEIKVWDLASGRAILSQANGTGRIFSRDGRCFVTIKDGASEITIWDVTTAGQLCNMKHNPREDVQGLLLSPNGKLLIITSTNAVRSQIDSTVWDVANGKELYRLERLGINSNLITFSPDSERIVAVSPWRHSLGDYRALRLWDARTGRELLNVKGGKRVQFERLRLSFSPDGHRLTLGDLGKPIETWDATPREEKPTRPLP